MTEPPALNKLEDEGQQDQEWEDGCCKGRVAKVPLAEALNQL